MANHEILGPDETAQTIDESIQTLWQVINRLSATVPAEKPFYRVTIFGSARVAAGQPLYEDVKRLASTLSNMGCDIVTGGGPGLMQAANQGENIGDPNNETRSWGLPVQLPFEEEHNPFVEKIFKHRTFFSRLHHFVQLSSAYVIVGGGIGTALETLMIWQLLQVKHIWDTPLIFVGPMWHGMVDWARENMLTSDPPFANAEDLDIPICVNDVDGVVPIIQAHKAEADQRRAAATVAP